jgi:ribonuclease R
LKKPSKKPRPAGLPAREDVVAFIAAQNGKAGVREMARAFGLKNADRASLRHMLRDLADEGVVEQRRKKLHHAGTLAAVVLSDITERDRDGELIAIPTEWDTEQHGEAPRIRVHIPRKARSNEIPGVGDRVLLRTEETGEEGPIRHSGRVIKILDRSRQRQLGVFRLLPNGGGRLEPSRPARLLTPKTATLSRSS